MFRWYYFLKLSTAIAKFQIVGAFGSVNVLDLALVVIKPN